MSPSGLGLRCVIVGSIGLLHGLPVLVASDRLCAFKREGLACVRAYVCVGISQAEEGSVGGGPE